MRKQHQRRLPVVSWPCPCGRSARIFQARPAGLFCSLFDSHVRPRSSPARIWLSRSTGLLRARGRHYNPGLEDGWNAKASLTVFILENHYISGAPTSSHSSRHNKRSGVVHSPAPPRGSRANRAPVRREIRSNLNRQPESWLPLQSSPENLLKYQSMAIRASCILFLSSCYRRSCFQHGH